MTKAEIISKIKEEVLKMNLRELYINSYINDLPEVYTKWYIDSEDNLYSIQAINNDEEPEAAFNGRDKFVWSICPNDLENVQFDQLDEDGNPISDEDFARSLTDEEFLNTIFGEYYDEKQHCFVDTDFEGYLEHELEEKLS